MKPSWEPQENIMDCNELIEELDQRLGSEIIGARIVDGRAEYLLRYRDGWPNKIVSAVESAEKWPTLLLRFLEQHIRCIVTVAEKTVANFAVSESETDGDPIMCKCKCNFHYINLYSCKLRHIFFSHFRRFERWQRLELFFRVATKKRTIP